MFKIGAEVVRFRYITRRQQALCGLHLGSLGNATRRIYEARGEAKSRAAKDKPTPICLSQSFTVDVTFHVTLAGVDTGGCSLSDAVAFSFQ